MTVFCWDGKYLAVDSRRTVNKQDVFDDSEKLDVDFKGIKFKGSYIRAVARAGNTRTTRFLNKAIRSGDEAIVEKMQKCWDKEKKSATLLPDQIHLTNKRKGTLLIVTRKKAWLLQLIPNTGVTLREIAKGETYSGGSGGRIGKFLMDTFGLSAQLAVCATMIHVQCCGGPVRYVNARGLIATVRPKIEISEFKDSKALKQEVMVRMRQMCGAEVRRLHGT